LKKKKQKNFCEFGTRAPQHPGSKGAKVFLVLFFQKKNFLPFLFLLHSAIAQPARWGLPQLMQNLAQVKTASARFTERQTMAILTTRLVAIGTLDYAAPDWMQKITTSPVPESFVLEGQQVTMTGPDRQTHVFSLGASPLIGGLTAGILATLAGDLPALQHVYQVQLSGGPAAWQLVLRPRDAQLARAVTWISIRGSQNRITEIDTQDGNGDHSEMAVDETISRAK